MDGSRKDPREAQWGAGAVEQGRFRRNIYLRVVGMWQNGVGRPHLGHNTVGRKKGSEAPPSRRSLGENDTAADRDGGQPLVSSLTADDSVNDAPTPLPRSRLSGRICDQP